MKVAVLAVQGAFEEHEKVLQELGAQTIQLRQAKDLEDSFDALVLPGGESTVQGKLLRELDMYEPLRAKIAAGLPVLATCAGLILLAEHIAGDDTVHFGTLPVTVKRNAYGRQLGSFETKAPVKGIGEDIDMVFIRAPYIESVGENVEILSTVDGNIVAAQEGNILVTSFHPELTEDLRLHKYFINIVSKSINNINCIVAQ